MLYGSDRGAMRRAYVDAWSKSRIGEPLEPLERLLADIIARHPEYHATLESPDVLERDFPDADGETNPFLHMGLHVAVREQIAMDRPSGVRRLYAKLRAGFADVHRFEHALMECLAETLDEARRAGTAPDEARYLSRVRRLAGRRRSG